MHTQNTHFHQSIRTIFSAYKSLAIVVVFLAAKRALLRAVGAGALVKCHSIPVLETLLIKGLIQYWSVS